MPPSTETDCRAIQCGETVQLPKLFCDHHWAMLVRSEKWDVLYACGTGAWATVLEETRRILYDLEHGKHPHPR